MSVIKKENIYLPKKLLDLSKWAVVACDQFTQDKDYWENVKNYVEGSPSTYELVLPEIELSNDNEEKIANINKTMNEYFVNGILRNEGECFILVNRSTPIHKKRLGLVFAIDLEQYNFKPEGDELIKASEGTIIERIPPRLKIRKDAMFEFPHILLLYDDREQKIADTLYDNKDKFEKVYDFNLNMEGGHIEGYKIKEVDEVITKFDKLIEPEYLKKTFDTEKPIMFVVGDGNHSLATAKKHWEDLKATLTEEHRENHPARFALIEAINIHDEGIEFEPIYRVLYNAKKGIVKKLRKLYKVNHKKDDPNSYKTYKMFYNGEEIEYDLPSNSPMAIKLVQDFIDKYLSKDIDLSVDYIHGLDALKEVCDKNKNSLGIVLPGIEKNDLFEYVVKHGVLPRKSFSIGEAREKRYYLEGHMIKSI